MSGTITLFSGLAVKKALDEGVLQSFTADTGVAVDTTYDPTNVLLQRIAEGARPDAMIGVTSQFDNLIDRGVIEGASLRAVAQTSIWIAAAPDVPPPDIATAEAFVQTLLTHSVAYSRTGASGVYFAELIERLGIAESVNERATVIEKGFTALAVADGRADLAVQQLSELVFVPEAAVVGPLPPEYQHITHFSAALGSHAAENPHALALIQHLTAPTARAKYVQTGLEVA